MKTLVSVLLFGLFVTMIHATSNEYGQNPQHEFGGIWDDKAIPVLPYWKLEGDATINHERIRLTPDRQSRQGRVWNTMANHFENFEVIFKLHVFGSGAVGADGLAFWYVKETDGSFDFFGYKEKFIGLGILIDTYDNDRSGDHPQLVGLVNDGYKKYDHGHGRNSDMEVGSCHFPLRSEPFSFVKVTYQSNKLLVYIDSGRGEWNLCFETQNVNLPTGYHFGFSAATGDLADNHDVHAITVRNLDRNSEDIDNVEVFWFKDFGYLLISALFSNQPI
eukprot:TRINITY_DN5855_c0_g1_i2.p1 TRINITY_DN5855_c0_g1~~TRINITY_DN5855_c0_g1_i2.p1  ORF type:complete len:276 (-),score=60.47 TRINITY_DN5855_c0_g1_i2:477-1304(-)